MGLDMYGYTMRAEFVGDRQTDVNVREEEQEQAQLTHFAYWRKFNHLQGWMEDLYREKGGIKESFNCCTVRLELEDLARLEADLEGAIWNIHPAFSSAVKKLTRKTSKKPKPLSKNRAQQFPKAWPFFMTVGGDEFSDGLTVV